jgi:hypothetical protein
MEHMYTPAGKLLELAEEVRSLELVYKTSASPGPLPDLSQLKIPLSRLTDLTIRGTLLKNLDAISQCMFHGQLKMLSIDSMTPNDPTIPAVPEGNEQGTSPITSLKFGKRIHISAEVLKELLQWPLALASFRSTLPGDVAGSASRIRGGGRVMTCKLSPAAISNILAPTRDTLEDLELIDTDISWRGHDASQLNLSDFTTLKKMNVSSTCFFPGLTPGRKRDGLYALLPPFLI